MKTIKDLVNTKKNRVGLVICAGSTIKTYKKDIDKFIKTNNPVVIGINNISHLYIPEYQLYTNTQRFRSFGKNINDESKLLLGSNISIKVIKEVIGNKKYILINYVDKKGIPLDYKKGKLLGHFRTAGCLAIMILHLMGVDKVNVVGMDGHTFHNYKDVVNGKQSHHCYEEDYKPFKKEICVEKDALINRILESLKSYGINFSILTPTIYKKYQGEL
jgi:hypothetical protein